MGGFDFFGFAAKPPDHRPKFTIFEPFVQSEIVLKCNNFKNSELITLTYNPVIEKGLYTYSRFGFDGSFRFWLFDRKEYPNYTRLP
jgi:hypothetical protein